MQDDSDPAADRAALYRQTWPRLIGVLVSIGGSRADAEAVAEDAYVKLLARWDAISRYDDPEAWVRGVAVRTMVSRLRRRQVVTRALAKLAGRPDSVRGPDDDAPDHEVPDGEALDGGALDVAAALARITPEQRAIVVLHDVLELPVDQIAVELQLASGAVKSRLARARRVLAQLSAVTVNE